MSNPVSQSASQPNVECKLSFWSKHFGRFRKNLTYKLIIDNQEIRFSTPKALEKRKTALTDDSVKIVNGVKIKIKDVFANTTDIKTINKNFKLATLSSIASKNNITRYDAIIKSACEGLSANDIASTFIDLINKDPTNTTIIKNIAKIVSYSSNNDNIETTACILAEYLTAKTNATVVNQQGPDPDPNHMTDSNKVKPHITFLKQLHNSNPELTKTVFVYLLTSVINKASSCCLMFDDDWKQNHDAINFRSINYDHIIYILSTMKENGADIKDINTELIKSALSQEKDYFQVGKLIKCAVTKQILSTDDIAKAINEYQHLLTLNQKQQILSGITDKKFRQQVEDKMNELSKQTSSN